MYLVRYLITICTLCLRTAVFSPSSDPDRYVEIDRELGTKLSPGAVISHFQSSAPRWSDYHAPTPGTVVSVAEELDVQKTVQYCIENNLDFLAQGGAHGWSTTFDIGKKDVVINLRGLNKVFVSPSKDNLTFGGGTIFGEIMDATADAGVQSYMGGSNCVGAMGAILGGGLGRSIGEIGLGVDNLLSVKLVTSTGVVKTVTEQSDPDLWWALRGAGANFGIVTSATIKTYPAVNDGIVWTGNLIYAPDQLEALVSVIDKLSMPKEGSIHLFYAGTPPDYNLTFTVNPWFNGPANAGRAAFAPLFAIGPVVDETGEIPYKTSNDDGDFFCVKGDRKPSYSAGLKRMDPEAFRKVWNEYVAFQSKPEFRQSSLLIECYAHNKVREVSDSATAFPHRRINFHATSMLWYKSKDFDKEAEEFGKKVRSIFRQSSGFDEDRAYINTAHGDENNKVIYAENSERLRRLKRRYDPHGRFDNFFPIQLLRSSSIEL